MIKEMLSLWFGVRADNSVAVLKSGGDELGTNDPLGRDYTCLTDGGKPERGSPHSTWPGAVRIDS